MPMWIRSALIRGSGTFCTGVVLMLMAWFSWSLPTSNLKTTTANAYTVKQSITDSKNHQISQSRWIEIDLSEQRLRAWEGKRVVYYYRISTGKSRTPTPVGRFQINSKYRTHRMRGPGYDIPHVPYTMYFYQGYAIHGVYWHNRFGTPVSHGCVNLPVSQARRLYNWAGMSTIVVVHR